MLHAVVATRGSNFESRLRNIIYSSALGIDISHVFFLSHQNTYGRYINDSPKTMRIAARYNTCDNIIKFVPYRDIYSPIYPRPYKDPRSRVSRRTVFRAETIRERNWHDKELSRQFHVQPFCRRVVSRIESAFDRSWTKLSEKKLEGHFSFVGRRSRIPLGRSRIDHSMPLTSALSLKITEKNADERCRDSSSTWPYATDQGASFCNHEYSGNRNACRVDERCHVS